MMEIENPGTRRIVDYFTDFKGPIEMSDEVEGGTQWMIVDIFPDKITLSKTKGHLPNIEKVLLKTFSLKTYRVVLAAKLRYLEAWEEK